MLKLYENGKLKRVYNQSSRNDLHNTYSTKNHKPCYRPGYKSKYLNQLNTNKGLLFTISILLLLVFGMCFGYDYRIKSLKNEIMALQSLRTHDLEIADGLISEYNNLLMSDPLSTDPNKIIEFVFRNDAETMKKIAQCESGMNPQAKNKYSNARGLFQIMASVHDVNEKWLLDPTINTLIAKKLYDASGLNPWNASRACWSK